MGLFSRFSKPKYADAQIVSVATRAIEAHPVIDDPGRLIVASKDGVVTLSGQVQTDTQVNHIEGVVNSALKTAGLKRAEIVNQLMVGK